MTYSRELEAEAVREIAFGSVTGSYANLGSAISHLGIIVFVQSSFDKDVYLSYDGTTNHHRIMANSGRAIDIKTNSNDSDGKYVPKGRQYQIKHAGAAPTEGTLSFELLY